MGTRASIAFIDYDKTTDKYLLFVSDQFNGDMGPDMANGEKLIRYFNSIYLDKHNHEAKRYKMERIIEMLNADFDYDREISFRCIPLETSEDGKVWINLKTKYADKEKKTIDYKNDIWSSWFDYSDYLYIVPFCNDGILVFCEDEDGNVEEHFLEKDYLDVFCFREYVGTVSPEDGKYTERNSFGKDDEVKEISEKEPFGAAPPLSIVPPRKFTEIITQYKDGDRYCLVVRDSDNKHVLFKEMR